MPYKGEYFADEDYEESYGKFIRFVAALVESEDQEERHTLLTSYFRNGYPLDISVSSIISDALTSIRVAFGHTLYECEQCGRLWLQYIPGTKAYVSYIPETEIRGVLRSRKKKT